MRRATLAPVLKWVGGKRQLLSEIVPRIPSDIGVYVEPFVGGGAVWLNLQPKRAIINDKNAELINVYRVVRDDVDGLLDLLREHAQYNSKGYYYEVRSWDRVSGFDSLSDTVRAARIIYLNKTCYNGLFRVNLKGQFNAPYGKYVNPDIVNEDGFRGLSAYLSGDVDIRCGDYAEVLAGLGSDAFVYLDPPYMPVSKTSAFTGYTGKGFDWDEQVRLRDECLKLKERGIMFLLSNSDCDAVRDLYEGFIIETVQARRAINSKGDSRGAVNEVLIHW